MLMNLGLTAEQSNVRPTDITWAQNLIADLQRDEKLKARWQQAEAAFCWTEAQVAEPTAERGQLLSQLIHIGQALEANVTRLVLVWENNYAPEPTDPAEVAAIQVLRAKIFSEDAA
jgi:hypothetical protein